MDWTAGFLALIDLRSFSNIWFWFLLALVWTQTGQRVIGVPFDILDRARRRGGQDLADVEALVAVHLRRAQRVVQGAGLVLVAALTFLHSSLLILALWYGLELALAVELLLLPLTFVWLLALFTANQILTEEAAGARLIHLLLRQRFWTQLIGMLAIFVTAAVAIYRTLSILAF